MPQAQGQGEKSEKTLNSDTIWLLALGANLTSSVGAPENTLRVALDCFKKYGAAIRGVSQFYSTPAFPAGNGPDYVNAVAKVSASWTPEEALDACHQIEAEFGRERTTRWGQRTLDLDLIACGDLVLPDAQTHAKWRDLSLDAQIDETPNQLILPHPRMAERAFVLVPLADVAPDWVHPLLGLRVDQMRDDLDPDDLEVVRPLG